MTKTSAKDYFGKFEDYLKLSVSGDASDLHFKVGDPILFRVNGELIGLENEVIVTQDLVNGIISEILNEEQTSRYQKLHSVDVSYEMNNSRFRINIAKEKNGPFISVRAIPKKIRNIEEVGFPNFSYKDIVALERGLVLVTGITGSGKSTTLASLIQEINRKDYSRVICIEDPIEYVHPRIKSSIIQRELHTDVISFAGGIEEALRQDPDVILIGEIRDSQTASSALHAAETGHLVFATIHTKDSSSTVNRLVDLFSEKDKDNIRSSLSENAAYILSQQLIPSLDNQRILAMEIMKNNSAIKNLIRSNQAHLIPSMIQTGYGEGMITMDRHLENLYKKNLINSEIAVRYAIDRSQMSAKFK
jgi:twitching motility protein PilT